MYSDYNIINIYNNYIILDIETNLIGKSSSIFKQSPKFVLGGLKVKDTVLTTSQISGFADSVMGYNLPLVGHNIGFDILVIASQHEGFRNFVLTNPLLRIWDTAVFEYMLSGQTLKYPSLAECARIRNLPLSKLDTVSEMMKSGIDPESIMEYQPELLTEYLIGDLNVTDLLFKSQLDSVENLRQTFCNLVVERQKFLLNTIRMSIQGMPFSVLDATSERDVLQVTCDAKRTEIESIMKDWIDQHCTKDFVPPAEEDDYFLHTMTDIVVEPEPVNSNSLKQLKTIFFGGEIDVFANGICGVYKTGARKGEPKFKTVTFPKVIPGLLKDVTPSNLDESVLSAIQTNTESEVAARLAGMLKEYRVLSKKLGTYYDAYIEAADNNRIHCDYNHTATPTGRITSCRPNLQNVEGE